MRIRSAHHARRYHARDRASRPMPTLCWLPFARKIRHKELFVDLFTPTALHLSLFRFPNNINLIGSAYFEFNSDAVSIGRKVVLYLKKSDCFLSCFHLKLLQIFKTNLAVVFTWWPTTCYEIQRMSGTEAVFRFATQRSVSVKYLFTCESSANRFFQVKVSPF